MSANAATKTSRGDDTQRIGGTIALVLEKKKQGDITITALYTSWCWRWGDLDGSRLLSTFWAWSFFVWVNWGLLVARLFIRGIKPLHIGLLHRHTAIDHLLKGSNNAQVLELASGLSRRGASFTASPTVRYTEVDLPKVVAIKKKLLNRSDAGKDVLERDNLMLVAGDVTELDLTTLRDPEKPLFVIAEGLCMYLSPEQQRAFWSRVADLLKTGSGGTFVFDLVPTVEQPKPGWFGRFLGKIMGAFTRGQTFTRDERTRQDMVSELVKAGFAEVELIEPGPPVARDWELPYPNVETQQLLMVCRT